MSSPRIKFEEDSDDLCLPFLFDLPMKKLVYVDDFSSLQLLASWIESTKVMGIDTEIQPNFTRHRYVQHKTSLIQLSLRSHENDESVFVVDILELMRQDDLKVKVDRVLKCFFHDRNITKIGHGLRGDLLELHSSYPGIDAFSSLNSAIETNALHKIIKPTENNLVSLKYLTRHYLHGNLIKLQQCSSWGLRPLNDKQILYAATDALVLLRLYDAIRHEIEDIFGNDTEVTIDRLKHHIISSSEERISKKRRHDMIMN